MKYNIKANILISDGKYSKIFTEKDLTSLEIKEPNNARLRLIDENQLWYCETNKYCLFPDSYYWCGGKG